MASVNTLDDHAFRNLEREVQKCARGHASLEAAARSYTSLVLRELSESVVLTRLFAAVPFGLLSASRADFATNLAASNGLSDRISVETPVLTLIGTSGEREEWNHTRASRGHVAIPFASSAFVDGIPMVARLLQQLGAGVDWIDRKDSSIIARSIGMMGGVFFVRDAATEQDSQGRKIIAGEQFVRDHAVKSAFGWGGGYSGSRVFIVGINFLREEIERETAERFLGHVNRFKASTLELVRTGALFDGTA